jgi:signal transduction histidine kinase
MQNIEYSKRRIIILIAALLLASFVSTSLISYFIARDSLEHEIQSSALPLTSDNVYSEVQRDMLSLILISSTMANDTFLHSLVMKGEKTPAEMTRYLKEMKDKSGVITSFFVSDKTRIYYQTQGILKKVEPGSPRDQWYFRLRKSKDRYELNIDMDMANNDAMTIFINYKVFDVKGGFIGVTGLGVETDSVQNLMEKYKLKYDRNIYFVTEDGKIILDSRSSPFREQNIKKVPELLPLLKKSSNGMNRSEYVRGGKEHFVNIRYIDELKWYLVVEQPCDSVNVPIFKALLVNLVFCIIATLIVVFIISWLINRHHKMLESMIKVESELKNINKIQKEKIQEQNAELSEKNDKLTELNDFRNKLLAVIAHDLRGPVGNIHHLLEHISEDLEKQASNQKMHDYTVSLRNAASTTYYLLENLLEWANIQFANIKYEPEEFALGELLETIIHMYESPIKDKELSVTVDCPEDMKVFSDRHIVECIVRNLVSNAVKFSNQNGSILLKAEKQGGKVAVAVKDTGIGIEEEKIPRLFGFESNISSRGTGGESGIGIGLSLCHDLALVNKSELKIESAPGKGSTFTLILPEAS